MNVNEDASATVLDLSNTFSDPDPGDSLTLSIFDNTNPALFTASLIGTDLTLTFTFGRYHITVC